MYLKSLTSSDMVKIFMAFDRVVDCMGNLKIFKGFEWDEFKDIVILYENDTQKALLKRSLDASKYQLTLNDCLNGTVHPKLNGGKKTLTIVNKDNIIDYEEEIFNRNKECNISNCLINKVNNNINTHFSILLYTFNNLSPKEFEILYKSFVDILDIANNNCMTIDNSIIYLNIFQRLIEYFRKCRVDFYISNDSIQEIDNNLKIFLKKCYLLFCIICFMSKLFFKGKITIEKSSFNVDIFSKFLKELCDKLELDFDEIKKELDEIVDKITSAFLEIFFNKLTQNGTKNVIYYGAPGTGKSKFVKDCLAGMGLDYTSNNVEYVQFHPSFEYDDFIDGIKPVGFSQNGGVVLDIVDGVFKRFCDKAAKDPKNKYFFIVDEINRANLASVFGETLSLLEDSYRGQQNAISTKNSPLIEKINNANVAFLNNGKSKFYIPENLYFIGMMNDTDKSIDCFDLALRRRFSWVLMSCDYEVIEQNVDKNYADKCKELNKFITLADNGGLNLGRAYEIGHSYFLKKQTMNEDDIWNRHIKPVLSEYIRSVYGDEDLDTKLKKAKEIFVK